MRSSRACGTSLRVAAATSGGTARSPVAATSASGDLRRDISRLRSATFQWLIIANTLDIPIDIPEEGDFGAGLGAARLGLIAAEGADPFAICTQPRITETIEPDRTFMVRFEFKHLGDFAAKTDALDFNLGGDERVN